MRCFVALSYFKSAVSPVHYYHLPVTFSECFHFPLYISKDAPCNFINNLMLSILSVQGFIGYILIKSCISPLLVFSVTLRRPSSIIQKHGHPQ